jgi:hypothetical protein
MYSFGFIGSAVMGLIGFQLSAQTAIAIFNFVVRCREDMDRYRSC